MRVVVMLLVALLLTSMAACDADDIGSAAGAQSSFRNLGKRGDSDLGVERSAARR